MFATSTSSNEGSRTPQKESLKAPQQREVILKALQAGHTALHNGLYLNLVSPYITEAYPEDITKGKAYQS